MKFPTIFLAPGLLLLATTGGYTPAPEIKTQPSASAHSIVSSPEPPPIIIWEPQPGPQSLAIAAPFIEEMLFGGARGGGKSDFLLGDFLQDVHQGPVWKGIIFRRTYKELEELIARALEIYTPLGAVYKVEPSTFIFPSGATLKMRYLETENDCINYQGHQYTWIGWDEKTNWPNLNAYHKINACLRSAGVVKNKRVRVTANPGGRGHHAVKAYFIDPAPMGFELISETDEQGYVSNRIFIKSKVTDNKILLKNDPNYIGRLRRSGSPELVKAWLDGDWDVITGAYYPEFSMEKHVIAPFPIPAHWLRFRSMDWGSATPFCVLWHTISEGVVLPNGKYIPAGAIVTYREFYGWNGKPNVGLRWSADKVARALLLKELPLEKITYSVLDPSGFKQDGGPSHAERMAMEGAYFRRADNSRVAGWDALRGRMCGVDGDPEMDNGVGEPMWYCFSDCIHLIRTLPALQHDKDNIEDCDTTGEDHAPDTLRYGIMSRPWTRPKEAKKPEPKTAATMTLNDWLAITPKMSDNLIAI